MLWVCDVVQHLMLLLPILTTPSAYSSYPLCLLLLLCYTVPLLQVLDPLLVDRVECS